MASARDAALVAAAQNGGRPVDRTDLESVMMQAMQQQQQAALAGRAVM